MTREQREREAHDGKPRLVDLATAAQRLSVCTRTLRRSIDLGQIHAVKVGAGRGVWRISEDEIERIIESGTVRR